MWNSEIYHEMLRNSKTASRINTQEVKGQEVQSGKDKVKGKQSKLKCNMECQKL